MNFDELIARAESQRATVEQEASAAADRAFKAAVGASA